MQTNPSSSPTVFPLLTDSHHYRACETDLLRDARAREHWLDVFESLLPRQLRLAKDTGATPEQCDGVDRAFRRELEILRADPQARDRLDILVLDELRQTIFRNAGIADECRLIKQRENKAALLHLKPWLERLDACDGAHARLELIVRGMLAGNLFDMGVAATAERFADGTIPFDEAMAMVPPRPWLRDDVDRLAVHINQAPLQKAVLFVDNAGGDFVLGLVPLARDLLRRGTAVILTANSEPSHNDVTHDEMVALLPELIRIAPELDTPRLALVPSGNDAPLIDLKRVSPELAAASADADLVVLVGMGRALESNFSARFRCAAAKIAMVKDEAVARAVGGRVFDAVCRFDPPA